MERTLARGSAFVALLCLCGVASGQVHVDRRPTVAVLYFDYSGVHAEMGVLQKGLAQMLIADLVPVETVRIVERARLEEIIAELKLQQSDLVDPKTAAKIGRILGARYLVLGQYFDLEGKLVASARVVALTSGTIHSRMVNSTPDDFLSVEQKLGEDLIKYFSSKEFLAQDASMAAKGSSSTTAPEPATAPALPKATPRVAPPSTLKTKTALAYSKALDAIDHKDKARAKQELAAVIKEQPDFRLAQLDMDRLIQ